MWTTFSYVDMTIVIHYFQIIDFYSALIKFLKIAANDLTMGKILFF